MKKEKSELERLRDENKKLKDEFMLKLAEAFLLPPTSNQMAVYKQWNYYKWYDEIKNLVKMENEYFYTEFGAEFVEVDVDVFRFVQVSRELGWMF